MDIIKMHYARYKKSYSDCEVVLGTYDKATKTIDVIIPEGRMKKSGVRGKRYHYMYFNGVEIETQRKVRVCVKSIDREHAIKQLNTNYPGCSFDVG